MYFYLTITLLQHCITCWFNSRITRVHHIKFAVLITTLRSKPDRGRIPLHGLFHFTTLQKSCSYIFLCKFFTYYIFFYIFNVTNKKSRVQMFIGFLNNIIICYFTCKPPILIKSMENFLWHSSAAKYLSASKASRESRDSRTFR